MMIGPEALASTHHQYIITSTHHQHIVTSTHQHITASSLASHQETHFKTYTLRHMLMLAIQ
jgi:hypothetical protein